MSELTCKNCGAQLKAEYKHCPNCGQKVNDDLTLGVLFSNTISNYFSVDARFFKSFIPLMFKPGFLAKKFVEGKRLTYLHPAQFYLFVSVVFFFIFSFYVREQDQRFNEAMQKDFEIQKIKDSLGYSKTEADSLDLEKILKPLKDKNINTGLEQDEVKKLDSIIKANNIKQSNIKSSFTFKLKTIDSLIAVKAPNDTIYKAMGMSDNPTVFEHKLYTQVLKLYKNKLGGIFRAFTDPIPVAMFFLLPIFAFILKLFFFKCGTYSHHLVFSFYFFSFLFIVLSLIFLLNYIIDIPASIDFLVLMSTFIYFVIAVKNFYKQGYLLSIIKSGVISFIYAFFVILPAVIILIILTALLFY